MQAVSDENKENKFERMKERWLEVTMVCNHYII